MKGYVISTEVADQVFRYLHNKPYIEVKELIEGFGKGHVVDVENKETDEPDEPDAYERVQGVK